jgi:hypothetical protein
MALDPDRDNRYNIIMSLFLGVVFVLGLNSMYDNTKTIVLKSDRTEGFNIESKCF